MRISLGLFPESCQTQTLFFYGGQQKEEDAEEPTEQLIAMTYDNRITKCELYIYTR